MSTLKSKHEKQIRKAIEMLNKTINEVREYIPEANYYLEDSSNFNVLSGHSHDNHEHERQDRIMLQCTLDYSGGGGW